MPNHLDAQMALKKHESFGLRLQIAVLQRHRNAAEFLKDTADKGLPKKGTFYYHWNGEKRPSREIVKTYERLTGAPAGWIENGAGERVDELREAVSALVAGDRQHPAVRRIVDTWSATPGNVISLGFNHPDKEIVANRGKPLESHLITILFDDQISSLLAGERSIDDMPGDQLLIPSSVKRGPRTFLYEVASTDFSMSGVGDIAFPPGSIVIIDPDQDALPGEAILIRQRGERLYMIRRYKAAMAWGKAEEFTLEATNPSFEPIRVRRPSDWEYGGCALGCMRFFRPRVGL